MWKILYLTTIVIPGIMVYFGQRYIKNPPKHINKNEGYRTKKSMLSKETWDFANWYCGKLWLQYGLALFVFALVIFIAVFNKDNDTQGRSLILVTAIQLFTFGATFYFVESALKKYFDNRGKRIKNNKKVIRKNK